MKTFMRRPFLAEKVVSYKTVIHSSISFDFRRCFQNLCRKTVYIHTLINDEEDANDWLRQLYILLANCLTLKSGSIENVKFIEIFMSVTLKASYPDNFRLFLHLYEVQTSCFR